MRKRYKPVNWTEMKSVAHGIAEALISGLALECSAAIKHLTLTDGGKKVKETQLTKAFKSFLKH